MQLVKPTVYIPDKGRSLPPDEFVQACRAATHISKIKSRNCKREDVNEKWRLGRK